MPYLIPDLPLGDRSRTAIRERQAEHICWWWEVLGGRPDQVAVDRSAGSRTRFVPATETVCFGADVNPGVGPSPNERMSWQAVVAHELRHLQRHGEGVSLVPGHLDECLTSLEAAAISTLSGEQQQELLEDALQRVLAREVRGPRPDRRAACDRRTHGQTPATGGGVASW